MQAQEERCGFLCRVNATVPAAKFFMGVPVARRAYASASKTWVEGPEQARFWRKQDPLFLTEFNERRMEHYGRVAYANLRFSQPSKGIAGWQTEPGKVYIKFGRFIYRTIDRYSHIETWYYEGFQVSFLEDGLDGMSLLSRSVFPRTPPRYVDPYRRRKYSLPHQVAAFRDQDSVRVEVAYAIPKSRIALAGPEGFVNLDDGLFLFDKNWEGVYKNVERATELETAGADSLRKKYLLSQRTVHVGPGQYQVVAEVRDRHQGSIGTFREARAILSVDTLLTISDLLLASRIEGWVPSPKVWEDLEIVPDPLRVYRRTEPVRIYGEVYNLAQDAYGRTEYEVSYRVGWPKKEEVDPGLFPDLKAPDVPEAQGYVEVEVIGPEERGRLGISEDVEGAGHPVDYRVRYVVPKRDWIAGQIGQGDRGERQVWETTVTVRYQGDRRDDVLYPQIDVSRMAVGIHKLTVTVRDVRTGQTAERDVLFRLME